MAAPRSGTSPASQPAAARPRSPARRPFFPSRSPTARRDARQTALSEWHRLDLEALERAWTDQARSVETVLREVIVELDLDRRLADAEVFKAWNDLVDPVIAAHARPAGLRLGTLFVNVDSSVWLDEIVRYRRREILTRLQNAFGSDRVAKISFRLG